MFELRSIPADLQPALEKLFAHHHRVDLAIQSILEGQTGAQIVIKVDDLNKPSLAQLEHGTFTVFAGEPNAEQAAPFIERLKKPCAIQPSPAAWIDCITAAHPTQYFTRYSFSHHALQKEHLLSLINAHPLKGQIKRLDVQMATDLARDEWGQYHFLNYHSPEQFIQKGIGFGVVAGNGIAAACTSALVCSKGIEMNIITLPAFRKKGLATLAAASLMVYCLEKGLEPHWDAANEVSRQLALKLGYVEGGEYGVVVCK